MAATGTWVDPDAVRMPAGEVHAWERGTNATVCRLQLSRQGLVRFPHVTWADAQPATGRHAGRGTTPVQTRPGAQPRRFCQEA